MSAEEFKVSSISRGVFSFKRGKLLQTESEQNNLKDQPQKKRAKKPSRKESRPRKGSNAKTSSKSSESSTETSVVANSVWARAESTYHSLQKEMFSDVLKAVLAFSLKAARESDLNEIGLFGDTLVPTCTLLTGVNLPDHEDFFKLLKSELVSSVSPHVASLRISGSGEDSACSVSGSVTLRNLMLATLGQLMLMNHQDIHQSDDEDESGEQNEGHSLKRNQLSLTALQVWYDNQYPKFEVPSNQRLKVKPRKPLIVMLEDFEAFPANVLQDFILNLIEFSETLPFVFIFGVATTVSVVHQKLPHHISSRLVIEKFAGQKSTEMLSKFVEKVVLDPKIPFKLSGRCLEMLLEIFLFSDFSVKRFLAGFKFAMSEHFSSSNLPSLLCTNKKIRGQNITKLDRDQLDRCRSLNSFRNHVEADPKTRASLLEDDEEFRTFLDQQLQALTSYTSRFNVIVLCLYEMVRNLPGNPLGQQLYSVYRSALVKNVTEGHEYRDCYQYMGHLSGKSLHEKLSKAYEHILEANLSSRVEDSVLNEIETRLGSYVKKLDDITSDAENLATKSAQSSPSLSNQNTFSPASAKKFTKFELQKALLERTKVKKLSSPFEVLRKEILEFCHEIFKLHLKPPSSRTFHEILFFDKINSVKRHLMAFPRGAIKAGLEDPIVYLENKVLEIESRQEILKEFPDVAIAYKLHAEQGKLINMYDWLQSWLSIVDPSHFEKEREINPTLQARFTEAVSALQFLGFVKSSKRKTDHMSKLTWGE